MAKILAIDDELETLDLVRILLEGAGYEVVTCSSGRKAWETIKMTMPDLVVLDIMLPGVDGYTLQAQMSQEESTRHIPVIMLTALEPAKTLFEKSENVAGFMTKPFKSEELLGKVKLALGSKERV